MNSITRHELSVVSAAEEYGPAGRLIQPVQQPEEGGLSRSARADDGKHLAPANVEGRAGDEDFPRNGPGALPAARRHRIGDERPLDAGLQLSFAVKS